MEWLYCVREVLLRRSVRALLLQMVHAPQSSCQPALAHPQPLQPSFWPPSQMHVHSMIPAAASHDAGDPASLPVLVAKHTAHKQAAPSGAELRYRGAQLTCLWGRFWSQE